MAVAPKKPQLVRDFMPKYRSSILLWHTLTVLLTLSTISLAAVGPQIIKNPVLYWSSLGALTLLVISAHIGTRLAATKPVSIVANAIALLSGEKTSTPLSGINDDYVVKSGLSPLLEIIYKPQADENIDDKATVDLERALNHTSLGIVVIGKNGKILYANKQAPVVNNSDGETHLELLFDSDESIEKWLKSCRKKDIRAEKTWRRIANKTVGSEGRKIYDISASYEAVGETEAVIAMIERTPDYITADEDLDFIAFAAHELRGPITVIRGYIDTLQDELQDRLQGDENILLDRLSVSASRLSTYIGNILNTAKYDRRHLKVHLAETSFSHIYDTIRDDMELRAASQSRLLSIDIPTDLPTIAADTSSFSEVIANLIDNAIKYSNEGSSITVTARASSQTTVDISVTDNGIGMPANVISNLFRKFYRSHRSRETVAGTGIGLYLSKAIVETHGGTISVRSVEGQGSTFIVSLPTYESVKEKLIASEGSSTGIIKSSQGWIKNHGSFRG